jgi:TRAP-type C4-dicarboxylate transport system permease large subunit
LSRTEPGTFLTRMGARDWAACLPTLVLLALVLLIGTGELVHSRFLQWGQSLFGDQAQYYILRAPHEAPTCKLQVDVDAEVRRLLQQAQPGQSPEPSLLDSALGVSPLTEASARQSVVAAVAQCRQNHADYARLQQTTTLQIRWFTALERGFFELFRFGSEHRSLLVLLLMANTWLLTSWRRQHISLVPPRTRRDHQVQAVSNALASVLMLGSSLSYLRIAAISGVPLERPNHQWTWIAVQAAVLGISAWQLWRPAAVPETGRWRQAWRTIPLGSAMAMLAGMYFVLIGHPAGLAIHVSALTEIPSLTLHLALFIWCGMLFKQSRMIDLFMNVLRPLQLSPETLTYVILLAAAVPTAYTGGSGAFVMAAGAIIYHEIRAVGGSHAYALGATAMSGSLGVVLNPSLVIMSIAAVNKEVTSDELFAWGLPVFMLTSTLFLLASQWRRPARARRVDAATSNRLERWRQGWRGVAQALPPLWSHVALIMAVIGFFRLALGTGITETSAALVMPVVMLLVVAFDQLMRRQGIGIDPRPMALAMHREATYSAAVRAATTETALHFGGYIYLILMSQALGGALDRADLLGLLPTHLGSLYATVGLLALMLVALGLVLEPLGAVLLVSGTLAPIAYQSGMAPIHFWMMVLVAFELGYLLPPVALNQLLARQAVGDVALAEADALATRPGASLWQQHERWLLPAGVMLVALLLVAFVPLWLQPWAHLRGMLHPWLP